MSSQSSFLHSFFFLLLLPLTLRSLLPSLLSQLSVVKASPMSLSLVCWAELPMTRCNLDMCVCVRPLTAQPWSLGWHPDLAISTSDADQMTAGTTLMSEQYELGNAFLDSAQSCQSETNTNHSRAVTKKNLPTPSMDNFCERTEGSLYLA